MTSEGLSKKCYKSLHNPGFIDLLQTSNPKSYFKTETLSSRPCDYHKLFISLLETAFTKIRTIKLRYRNLTILTRRNLIKTLATIFIKTSRVII